MSTDSNMNSTPVGLLVAGMMSNVNEVNQKAQKSQKDIDQQLMEQNIAQALQAMENSNPNDLLASLNAEKNFLGL